MKRIVLTVAFLLGGTAVAHANPPGMTPGPTPYGASQHEVGPGDRIGPRGVMRGPRAGGKRHLAPQLKARLVAMFDRDQDGRLEGRERRAAKRFVRKLVKRQAMQGQRGDRGQRGQRGRR